MLMCITLMTWSRFWRLHMPHRAVHGCRLWMEKQEAAFSAWLNSILVPAKTDEEGPDSQALAARRVAARVRGLLWHLYSADKEVITSMLKVEKHIDAGQLRLKDEVSQPAKEA